MNWILPTAISALVLCLWDKIIAIRIKGSSSSQEEIQLDASSSSTSTSLVKALALEAPVVSTSLGGESEHLEFWQTNEYLLQDAWKEWAQQQQANHTRLLPLLPKLIEKDMINPQVFQRIHEMWDHPVSISSKEDALWHHQKEQQHNSNTSIINNTTPTTTTTPTILEEPIPNVYTCRDFLSTSGIHKLRQHLDAAQRSGIPRRRPNGMNRYGLVLDEETQGGVSYPEIDKFLGWMVDTYVRPLGRMLFQEYIASPDDDESSYAFTIHYEFEPNSDIALKEHSDASAVTININLNLPGDEEESYEGSSLVFVDGDEEGKRHGLQMEPGMAVIHRGLHRHQALPIEKGQRHQLIIWLFGRDGYVRFAPYEPSEWMSVEERWSKGNIEDGKKPGFNDAVLEL